MLHRRVEIEEQHFKEEALKKLFAASTYLYVTKWIDR
jgi:hypothetical protein